MKLIKTTFTFLFFFLLLILIISNRLLTINKYVIEYNNLPANFDGYKIVHLSDLHSKTFGKNNKKLLKKINKINPNIIVMTGDMVNTTDENFNVFINLSNALAHNYDVYYIVGNHEQNLKIKELKKLYKNLKNVGINVLDNEKLILKQGTDTINIYGLWFNLRYYSDQTNEAIKNNPQDYYFSKNIMDKIITKEDGSFTVLLTHNPMYFNTYIEWGADLILTGHVHGGMIRIPFVGGIFSPEKTYFPEYDSGIYIKNNQKMIISRGLGNGNDGIRFWNAPEIISIELKRQ